MRILVFLLTLICLQSNAQTYAIKDIKSFGAKGDGRTNDHDAFERAAAFFNQRGGYGRLVISKGTYIIGKQSFTQGKNNKQAYDGEDVLHFTNVRNLTVQGTKDARLKYQAGLRFGAFNPETGRPHLHGDNYFVNWQWAATLGHCIFLDNCRNISVRNIEMDGSNNEFQFGGVYGDVGIQLPHYGIFIKNSRSITIEGVNLHHFALDGISISNAASKLLDSIKLKNSRFEYNSRQGLSWIGGNDLKATNCKFSHTGQAKTYSAPGAGLDIEAESGPIRNGKFENCEFVDNKGCAMVADSGDSGDCSFDNCTFWGVENWSVWTTKPGFTFTKCNFYGSIVHGYDSPNDKDATKYISCHFEDKAYDGKEPYGAYLIETNGMRRVSFTNCAFVSNRKKLMWMFVPATTKPDEKYRLLGCTFIIKNTNLPKRDFIAVIRGIFYKDCSFEYQAKVAKEKGWYLNACCENYNIDAGGNKIIYTNKL